MVLKYFRHGLNYRISLVVLLIACSPQETTPTFTSGDASPGPTVLATAIPPTATLIPPSPTAVHIAPTPTTTHTPPPSPTPTPAEIMVSNVEDLGYVQRYGDGLILGLDISPDGEQFVVLTSVDLRMYDTATGELQWQVEPDIHYQGTVFSEEGDTLLAVTDAGTVRILDAADGTLLSTVFSAQPNNVVSQLSSFGNYLTSYDIDRNISIYETSSGAVLLDKAPVLSRFSLDNVKMSPDGTKLIVFGYHSPSRKHQVQVWDAASGDLLNSLKFPSTIFFEYLDLEYSFDGRRLAFLATREGPNNDKSRVLVWETDAREPLTDHRLDQYITAFCFGANGAELIVGDDAGALQALDIETLGLTQEFPSHLERVVEISASADGRWMISADLDGNINILNIQENRVVNSIQLPSSKTSPASIYKDPDFFDTGWYPIIFGFALSPDGNHIARSSADGHAIEIINLATGELIQELGTEGDYYSDFAYSTDGRIAASRDDYSIAIWELETGEQTLVIPTGIEKKIVQLQFSPDGKWLASLSDVQFGYDGAYSQLIVWDSETGEKVQTFFGYLTFDFSPDGKNIVSDNIDYGLYVWGVESGDQVASDPAEYIFDLEYAPDNTSIAVASWQIREDVRSNVNLVYFVDVENEYERTPLKLTEHLSRPYLVAYAPDGSILATGDIQGNVYLWEVASGRLIKMLPEVTSLLDITFTPDQRSLVVVGTDGDIRLYAIR